MTGMKFILKAAVNAVIVVSMLLWMSDATFIDAFVTSLALSVVAWLIGDQFILRKTNNLVATIADSGLALVFLWGATHYFVWTLRFSELLMIVAVPGIAEYVIHRVLQQVDGPSRF